MLEERRGRMPEVNEEQMEELRQTLKELLAYLRSRGKIYDGVVSTKGIITLWPRP